MPKILIIEDDPSFISCYRVLFEQEEIDALVVTTLIEALQAYKAHPDIAAVFVDGLFPHRAGESHRPGPGRSCSGVQFLRAVEHRCPMFACSSDSGINRQMREAGAVETCEKGMHILIRAKQILADMAK